MAERGEAIAEVKRRLTEETKRRERERRKGTLNSATAVGLCDRTIDLLLARLANLLRESS